MRISYLTVSDQLGGSEVVLLEILKGVRQLRPSWALQVILPGRGPLFDRATAAGADCVAVPMPASLARLGESGSGAVALAPRFIPVALALPAYVGRIRETLEASGASIVHTNGFKAHIVGARAAAGSSLIWHMHEYVGGRRVTRSFLRRHQGRVAGIVANSRSVAADVTKVLRPRVPVRVVENAVDLAEFSPDGPVADLDRLAGLPPAAGPTVRVGLVAIYARWKGHDVFLEALATLPSDLPVRGYVIGGPLYDTAGSQYSADELRRLAARLGLGDRVGFTGLLPAAPAMRALDVVVHASTRPEPFGMVIAEAMSCGRAVIASAASGAAELARDGYDALTHTPGDSQSLASCIARLVGDMALRRTLGSHARASACERFDSARFARDMIDAYEAIKG
jgi:glycosyltransferase involved in cell wall biosynthesis